MEIFNSLNIDLHKTTTFDIVMLYNVDWEKYEREVPK